MLMRIVILAIVALGFSAIANGQSTWGAETRGPVVLSWSAGADGPLFVLDEKPKSKDGLIYDGGEFSLRLADVLTYDREMDSFSLWLGQRSGEQLVMLKRNAGSYRGKLPARGDLGLNDFGKLKLLWLSTGERFLFTEINSVWHCVTIENARGRKLYIDYDREGAISRVREGERIVEPVYENKRLVSVRQTWPGVSGKFLTVSVLR